MQELNLELTPFVIPNCPSALSVGKLCIDNGFGLWWPPHSHTPILTRPDGVQLFLRVTNYTPELDTNMLGDGSGYAADYALPATAQ